MDKQLNTPVLTTAMEKAGLNQSALARELSVSRESVSKWLNGQSFPRPDKLLRLGKITGLAFSELVVKEEHAPVVAFRRMKGTRTKDHHVEHAQTMGRMLRHLITNLPFDILNMPPVLKEPRCDYAYLQDVATKVRNEIASDSPECIDFHHLIGHFRKLQAVLIPVMWGTKNRHENATHIFLPDSQTTWVYLNLDVNIHDFKFWMAHELGHCLAPNLRGDEGEDFADAFAGALLLLGKVAGKAYETIAELEPGKKQLGVITQYADEYMISPYTVYCEVNAYARSRDKPELNLEPDIHKWTTTFNKNFDNLSTILFENELPPEPVDYIRRCEEVFDTPFFRMLAAYLKEEHKGPGFVQTVMDIPLLDARELHRELS